MCYHCHHEQFIIAPKIRIFKAGDTKLSLFVTLSITSVVCSLVVENNLAMKMVLSGKFLRFSFLLGSLMILLSINGCCDGVRFCRFGQGCHLKFLKKSKYG